MTERLAKYIKRVMVLWAKSVTVLSLLERVDFVFCTSQPASVRRVLYFLASVI